MKLSRQIARRIPLVVLLSLGFFLPVAGRAVAASFDIHPINIHFDAKSRIEKLTIRNLSDEEFPLQVKVFKWEQNEKGADVYSETNAIIVFPKILTIRKSEEKIIRVGTNLMPGASEKTYRMYVEEIPSDAKKPDETGVRVFMKVGVPLFLAPLKTEEKGAIESFSMQGGKAQITVRNTGNVHFVTTAIALKGEDEKGQPVFQKDVSGWYILNGAAKTYEAAIPPETCGKIKKLDVQIKAGELTLTGQVAGDRTLCGKK